MNTTLRTVRAWAVAAAIGAAAIAGTSVANAAASDGGATTSTVTKGDLTQRLSWSGELAYANAASLTYKGGQSDAGGPQASGGGLASAVVATKTVAFDLALDATDPPAPTDPPSASPTPSPSPSPTPSPSPSPTPNPGGGPTCQCTGQSSGTPTFSFGGASSGGTAAVTAPTVASVGLVTWLPASGSLITSGSALYRVDNEPVVLLEGKATLYRDLAKGDTGDDVLALEEALAALGYDADMTVDGTFTAITAANLRAFQTDMGIEATGTLDITTVVMHDGPVVVSTLVAAVGDEATSGTEILVMADQERDVTLALDPSQLTSIALGDLVSVKLLDGTDVDATVTAIAAAPSTDGTFALTARLDPSATVLGDHLTVTVSFSRVLATGALLIDPYALVLLEGNRTVVRVLRGGTVVDVEVAVIATAGRSTAVSSTDLVEGDTIES